MTPEDLRFYGEFALALEANEKIMLTEVQRILDSISTDSETRLAEHIKSRIKSSGSLCEKLERQGLPVSAESGLRDLSDIIGLRVVTHFVGDIYTVLEKIEQSAVWRVVAVKDYIAHAKPNGYRSLHVIVRIPVYFMDSKEMVPVEVQIRTIAMDYWASLEHDLKYKAVAETHGLDIAGELQECSQIIEGIEQRMQVLANALDAGQAKHTKLSK